VIWLADNSLHRSPILTLNPVYRACTDSGKTPKGYQTVDIPMPFSVTKITGVNGSQRSGKCFYLIR
jgi:hypothetical protein